MLLPKLWIKARVRLCIGGVRTLLSRALAPLRRAALDRELDEELASHLEMAIEENRRRGLSAEEARTAALRSFGGITQVREAYRLREGLPLVHDLLRDLAYALRQIRKGPGFTLTAVLTLALGIGANTVIFTAARHALLDRLSVSHPEQLRLLWWSDHGDSAVHSFWGYFEGTPDGGEVSTSFSYPVYQQLRRENHSLAGLFAFKPVSRMTAAVDGRARAADAEMVSGNFFSALGVRPALGRAISEVDDSTPASPVIVISDRFWTTAFGRATDVIGKVIDVNFTPMTIIGVAPPGFTGAYDTHAAPDIFLPLSMQPIVAPMGTHSLLTDNNLWWVLVMGRSQPGVSAAAAAASLQVTLNAAVRATLPVTKDAQLPHLLLRDGSRGQNEAAERLTKPIYVLMGLAGFVLLLASANLANLLLARASTRQREMSVRMALGAARRRILRQMLTESLLLSLLGGAAGLLLGFSARHIIPRLLSNAWQAPAFAPTFDWPIFGFTAAISLATGLIFGLAPAWQASRTKVCAGLKKSAQTTTQPRRGLAGRSLVIVQVSLSMLLLVGAGLFVRTLINLGDAQLGFRPHDLLLFDIEPPANRYSSQKAIVLFHDLEDKLSAIPGVHSVTLSENALISGSLSHSRFVRSGEPGTSGKEEGSDFNIVGHRFFSTMGIPIVAGRGFTDADSETSTKVAVIDRQLAREFFPHTNPLGQTFTTDLPDVGTVTIVGICGNVKYARVTSPFRPTYYLDYRQHPAGNPRTTFEVSTQLRPQALVPALQAAVASVDKNLPLLEVRTQEQQIEATMQEERILARLTATFGILALLLACIGIYGMMAYSVSRRTNEIGIRIALGARSEQVLRMVLSEAAWMTALGVLIGLSASLALGRIVAALLFGLKSWDPATLACSAAVLAAVSAAASWIPAQRAAHVDPSCALRAE